jgi:hypothetical protein
MRYSVLKAYALSKKLYAVRGGFLTDVALLTDGVMCWVKLTQAPSGHIPALVICLQWVSRTNSHIRPVLVFLRATRGRLILGSLTTPRWVGWGFHLLTRVPVPTGLASHRRVTSGGTWRG